METKLRTLVRTISYRLSAFALTLGLTWLYTHDLDKSTLYSSAIHAILSLDYYIHERLWLKIHWGKVEEPDTSPPPAVSGTAADPPPQAAQSPSAS